MSAREPVHATREVVHDTLDLPLKLANATLAALNVLHDSAERSKLRAAALKGRRALVHALGMCGALQVSAKVRQLVERTVA